MKICILGGQREEIRKEGKHVSFLEAGLWRSGCRNGYMQVHVGEQR
jgi:hypothetical protein